MDQHRKDTIVLVTEKVMPFESLVSNVLLDHPLKFETVLCSGMQDYDRDPAALRTLDAKVWVLSSSLQIMPHKEHREDEFMRKVNEIITITGRAKSHAVDRATSC